MGLGFTVFLSSPRRLTSQAYLALSALMTAWLSALEFGFMSTTHAAAEASVRWSSAVSALFPLVLDMIRTSIVRKDAGWRFLLRKSVPWAAVTLPVIALCFSRLYLTGASLPPGVPVPRAAEPAYGLGLHVFGAFYFSSLGVLAYLFARDVRASTSIQRTELQFVLLASALGILLSLLASVVVPAFTGTSRSVMLIPLAEVVFLAVLAYGIAVRRILEVGHFLRALLSYALLVIYLGGLYWAVNAGAFRLLVHLAPNADALSHLLAALALAFSLAPVHGRVQQLTNRFFARSSATDVSLTMHKANLVLQSIGTLDDVLKRFALLISESVGSESVTILLSADHEFQQAYPPGSDTLRLVLPADAPLMEALNASPGPLVADLIRRQAASDQLSRAGRSLMELCAAAAVGIRYKGQLAGVVLLGPRFSGRIYGGLEQRALEIVGAQLAVAIENAKLYTEVENSRLYNEILVDNLVSGVIAADNSRRVTVFNREAQRITRVAPEQVVNRPISTLPPLFAQNLEAVFSSGLSIRNRELIVSHGPQDATPIQLGGGLFYGRNGVVLGAFLVFSDMSLVRKLETQVRRAAHLASLGTLSAGMAHEIKNPLVTLKTVAQLLPERYDDRDFRETFSELVEKEVNRIDSIVNRLLKFGRPAEAKLKPTSLHEVIHHSIELVQPQLNKRNVVLTLKLEAADDRIMADANLLEQALVNFLLNAMEAMKFGGQLSLTTDVLRPDSRAAGDVGGLLTVPCVHMAVRDTGEGIKPQDLPRIFDPFFTTKSSGTGLGLSVTHGIIQEHNGVIDVESVIGQGTTFHVFLPTHSTDDGPAAK